MGNNFVSIIATTYNQPDCLDLYLATIASQTHKNFEIIIADDGSSHETKSVVEKYKNTSLAGKIKHVWHEDKGYRKTVILNKAIRICQGEIVVFTDTDVIVHENFLEDHIRYHQKYDFFMGRRVDASEGFTKWLLGNSHKLFSLEFYIKLFLQKCVNANRIIRIKKDFIARIFGAFKPVDLLGSNFSISKKLLLDINGFDENYKHYWGEDGDLFIRARNSGAKIIGRKYIALQVHLWHKFRTPSVEAQNDYYKRINEDFSSKRCEKGVNNESG